MTKDKLKILYRLVRDKYITEDEFLTLISDNQFFYYKLPTIPMDDITITYSTDNIVPNYIFEGYCC